MVNDRLKHELKHTRDQTGSLDQQRQQLAAQLQAHGAKVAELEMEVGQLRERAVEADRREASA